MLITSYYVVKMFMHLSLNRIVTMCPLISYTMDMLKKKNLKLLVVNNFSLSYIRTSENYMVANASLKQTPCFLYLLLNINRFFEIRTGEINTFRIESIPDSCSVLFAV